tara:strand:- start:643 stop:1497 length:855 start_codon:yes stop_codon:yes gene_type:complete
MCSDNLSKVTAGMPVYNGALFIENSIRSLMAQTYLPSLIVVDNHSNDSTCKIVSGLKDEFRNIELHSNSENLGPTKNFLLTFFHCKTEYFFWAAADDLWSNDWIEKLLNKAEASQAALTFGNVKIMDQDGLIMPHPSNMGNLQYMNSSSELVRCLSFFMQPEIYGQSSPIYGLFNKKILSELLSDYHFIEETYVDYLFISKFLISHPVEFANATHYKRIHSASWTDAEKGGKNFKGHWSYISYLSRFIVRSSVTYKVLFTLMLPFKLGRIIILRLTKKCLHFRY